MKVTDLMRVYPDIQDIGNFDILDAVSPWFQSSERTKKDTAKPYSQMS